MEPYDDVILQYPMYDVTNLSLLFAQLLQILNLGLCDEQVTFQLRAHLKQQANANDVILVSLRSNVR